MAAAKQWDATPPNYPDPVPFEWCLERQKRVLGFWWWLSRGLVYESARELKRDMDEQRAKDRAFIQWSADLLARNRAALD